METFLYVFLGVIAFFLLLGILLPIFLLIKGLVFGYKKLDEKWTKDAEMMALGAKGMPKENIPTFEVHDDSLSNPLLRSTVGSNRIGIGLPWI